MIARVLRCTKCSGPTEVIEYVETIVDYGPAVIDGNGVVRPVVSRDTYGDKEHWLPLRAIAICLSSNCRYRWVLRRKFDPIPLEG